MADRRMFSKKITDADQFTELPPTAQLLYFHLCMSADDDGFTNAIRKAMFNAHATVTDFNTLVDKRFIIPFESGVIVIKHWKLHNYIQNDRYHATQFIDEKAQLVLKQNGVYTEKRAELPMDTDCIQDGYRMDTEVRLGKDSQGKDNSCAKEAQTDTRFNIFWDEYPKHQDKAKAEKAFLALHASDELFEKIMDGLRLWKSSEQWTQKKYIPLPTVWIHGKRWEDEDIPQAGEANRSKNAALRYEQKPISKADFDAMVVNFDDESV